MADHRAEQILAAWLTKVTSLTTTGARVGRSRVYPIQAVPRLDIFMGADSPVKDSENVAFVDSVLTVINQITVSAEGETMDTTLNKIRKEIVVAIQAGLGLSFVIDVVEGPTTRPELSDEAEQRTATQELTWFARYRRSIGDPSA